MTPDDLTRYPLLGDLPSYAAERWPDSLAIVFRDERLMFREIDEAVDRAARGLMAVGLQRGDKVGLFVTNRTEFIVATFAALRIGCVAVPFNTRYRENDLAYVLMRAECKVLIAVDQSGPVDYLGIVSTILPELEAPDALDSSGFPELKRVVVIGERNLPGTLGWAQLNEMASAVPLSDLRARQASVRRDDLALIIFTSGTTGQPKGVMHDHSCVRAIAERARLWRIAPGEITLNYLPMFHLYSFSEIIISGFLTGTRQIVLETFNGEEVLDLVERERVNILHGFDTHYSDFLRAQERKPRDLSSLRFGTFPSGMDSTIPVSVKTQGVICPTVSGTSASETWCWMVTSPIDAPQDERCRLAGRPLSGFEVRVVDPETKQDVSPGVRGELLFRGYTLMKGYFADREATDRAIDGTGWYHSGDQGIIYLDGTIQFTGRYKEMLKVGGENVSAQGVEFELKQLVPEIRDVAVVSIPDERLAEVPVAYVVMHNSRSFDEHGIIAACKGKIASFKIPRHVFQVDALPQTASGKIQRFILKAKVEEDVRDKIRRAH